MRHGCQIGRHAQLTRYSNDFQDEAQSSDLPPWIRLRSRPHRAAAGRSFDKDVPANPRIILIGAVILLAEDSSVFRLPLVTYTQMRNVIFITGVSSGIGAATARLFAARGWNVVGTVRREDVAGPWGNHPNVEILKLDVNDGEAVSCIAAKAISVFGRIDVVVNNAGYFQMGPLETSSMEQIRSQYETNVFGLIGVTKAFLPYFRQQGCGLFINISSVSAENGYPFGSVYSSTKGAVVVLTEALNVELAGIGVSAKAVLPGLHATRIFTKVDVAAEVPDGYLPLLRKFLKMQESVRGSDPEIAAEVVWKAATDGRSDRVRYYSGPDASSIPLAKRLMGGAGYWSFFRKTLLAGPGWLTRLMTPQGNTVVEIGDNVRQLKAGTP